jgi:hypothetical protein
MMMRLMMTACWVRLSLRKSSLARPSKKVHASVALLHVADVIR